ncbi:MAG: glycosyltransferase [Acidobacteriota bacterium]|nr:glycosyltransferase [Acidobacteriota bacterium]
MSVSIVIPCYNQAHFLGAAIESALAQTHPDREIIVVDDGSPDTTAEVVARYPGVRYIRQSNQGLGAARNAGLRESTGDYIVFMDSDDRLLPHTLSTNLDYFKSHPECAYVAGRTRYITHSGKLLPTSHAQRAEKEHYRELLRRNATPGIHSIMFRRAVFDVVGGFSTRAEMKGAEDYDLYLRLARIFPVYYHDGVIAEYRLNLAGMSRDPTLMLHSTLCVLRAQKQHVKGSKADEQAYRQGIKNWQLYYGELAVSHIRLSVRKRHWRQALRSGWALLRGSPLGLVKHAYRKTYRTIFRIESEPEHEIIPENQIY